MRVGFVCGGLYVRVGDEGGLWLVRVGCVCVKVCYL